MGSRSPMQGTVFSHDHRFHCPSLLFRSAADLKTTNDVSCWFLIRLAIFQVTSVFFLELFGKRAFVNKWHLLPFLLFSQHCQEHRGELKALISTVVITHWSHSSLDRLSDSWRKGHRCTCTLHELSDASAMISTIDWWPKPTGMPSDYRSSSVFGFSYFTLIFFSVLITQFLNI